MSLQCGIVGLPNVGKSTVFNALTYASIEAANYPFCTIDPNIGSVPIPDRRLQALANIVKPQRIVPTTIEFVDIAGLVQGASQGAGLGNQFLGHIRQTDAIAQVVRCFDDPNIIHVNNQVNPIADIDTIQTELALADLSTLERAFSKIHKNKNVSFIPSSTWIQEIIAHLNQGNPLRQLNFTLEERKFLQSLQLLTLKPMFYIANVPEGGLKENSYFKLLQERALKENTQVIPICAKLEAELVELEEEERLKFLEELQLEEPALSSVVRTAYDILGLQTFFTAGVQEVRAWTILKHSLAPSAAGCIHSDFERGFISAQVIPFEDFIKYQGEKGAREAGKLRSEGRKYCVQDGDVIHFLYNV